MANHGGQFTSDCETDEATLDLADRLMNRHGVIDPAAYRRLLRPRLQARVTRSAEIDQDAKVLASELVYGLDAYRAKRRRAERDRARAARAGWRVVKGGKGREDEPLQAA